MLRQYQSAQREGRLTIGRWASASARVKYTTDPFGSLNRAHHLTSRRVFRAIKISFRKRNRIGREHRNKFNQSKGSGEPQSDFLCPITSKQPPPRRRLRASRGALVPPSAGNLANVSDWLTVWEPLWHFVQS